MLMKKSYYCLLVCLFFFLGTPDKAFSQVYQLLAEDFETGAPTVILNDSGPSGAASGVNRWVINNSYNGQPTYPNTISQDSTVSGTIGGAPNSYYLHIHDTAVVASGISNANYDPASASDNFTVIGSGLCTKGFTDVTLAFFYLSEGTANDYGSLFYSADNGPWTQVGQPKYNSQSLWKYEVLTDSAFDNVTSLRFGFRWQNAGGGSPASTSFSIDDIEIIGTYDSVSNPINILITQLFPDTVCQNNLLFVFWDLTDSLCDGFYEVELSDLNGTFLNPTNLGVFQINNFQTAGAVAVIIPPTTPAGGCYRIRINRVSPPPAITGIASVCFVVNYCPNTVTTLQPPVTLDTNGVCINSVIDVPFYSTGVFVFNNYIAELSDSSGSFANPYFIGSKFDDNAYDPSLGSPPGMVGGLVPVVPPGCNYYVRVRATSPATIGSVWGPFCIRECDIETNHTIDVNLCINSTTGDDTLVYVNIHSFDSLITYLPGNMFEIQVLDFQTLALVNQGGLGSVASVANDSFLLSAPPLPAFLALPMQPGSYYARIVATNSSDPDNAFGTMIHLKIGAPADVPPVVTPSDSVFCTGDIGSFFINPYNFNSQYQWWCNGINSGQPFFWDYYPLLVQYGGPSTLYFTVREWNYGCPGPVSDTAKVVVLTVPNVFIIGPVNVCKGDTVHYKVAFAPNTYFSWTSSDGTITDTANNEIDIVFDSVGVAQISIFALNKCGSDTGFRNITVHDLPVIDAGSDTAVCAGSPITLSTPTGTGYSYNWTSSGGPVGNTSTVTVNPAVNTTYYLTVTSSPVVCKSYDTVDVSVAYPMNEVNFSDSACAGENVLLDPGVSGTAYQWSTGATSSQVTVSGSGTFVVTITVAGELCNRTDTFFVYPRTAQVVTHTDSLCAGDTLQLDPGFSTGTYSWSTGETSQQIQVTGPGTYSVAISIAGNPCYRTDSFNVSSVMPLFNTFIDSLCLDSSITISASLSGGTYQWNTGATGLSILVQDTGIYTVLIHAPGIFCYQQDTFVIAEKLCPPPEEVSFTLPNIFTPNDDGLNDQFEAITKGDYDDFYIDIYNRWGRLVFESRDTRFQWDGKDKQGQLCPDGVYFYIARTTVKGTYQDYRGTVTLIRDGK